MADFKRHLLVMHNLELRLVAILSFLFNFYLICNFQMFPLATVCGNTMVIKPSERDPGATMILCELANEAGFPPGVVNVIHGSTDGELS